MKVNLTVEQMAEVQALWSKAKAVHPPDNLIGELRRADFTEAGQLYIDFRAVPAHATEAMRAAYAKAVQKAENQ